MKNCRPKPRETRVQFFNPITDELVARVPAQVCPGCDDVVPGMRLDKRTGLCPCCTSTARLEKTA
jgi:hypothetical protein